MPVRASYSFVWWSYPLPIHRTCNLLAAVEWEQAAWDTGAATAGGGFAAQQLFATQDWKVQQQRRARIATSGRWVLLRLLQQ